MKRRSLKRHVKTENSSSSDEIQSSDDDDEFQVKQERKKLRTVPKKVQSKPKKEAQKTKRRSKNTVELMDIEDLGKHQFNEPDIVHIREQLLAWYDSNQRKLPWRKVWDPNTKEEASSSKSELNNLGYGVWVSEIMLQQTRVETVIAYYKKWMEKWPTVFDLARASLEEVNEVWTGLGYYRRAKFLHEGARWLVQNHKGKLPRSAAELKKIPGIGPYTAGAISSIAFGEVSPVVDGNVIRVLSRLRAIGADSTNKSTVNLFWKLATDLVDINRPGCFNQALMELGATICTPKSPKCDSCPVSLHCLALQEVKLAQANNSSKGAEKDISVTKYPVKPQKLKQREETVLVCLLERKWNRLDSPSEFLLVQRPATGLLASLWEFPSVNLMTSDTVSNAEMKNRIDAHLEDLLGTENQLVATLKRNCENRNKNAIKQEEGEGEEDQVKIERCFLGEATFLFSHIKHTYLVEWLCVTLPAEQQHFDDVHSANGSSAQEPTGAKKRKRGDHKEQQEDQMKKEKKKKKEPHSMRWLKEKELASAAVPKGMKNCYELFVQWSKKTPKERLKATQATSTKRQKKIETFFLKQQ